MKQLFFLFVGVLLVCFSCKKEDAKVPSSVKIQFNTLYNQQKVNTNTIINTSNNPPFKVDILRYYISNIRFINDQGDVVNYKMEESPGADLGVFLYDLSKDNLILGSLPEGNYTQIQFDFGLAPSLNDMNPNQFDSNHPLSRDTDMFWDMLKYRFVVWEGEIDTANDGNFHFPYTYHLGGDEFLRSVQLNTDFQTTSNNSTSIEISLQIDSIFDNYNFPIDMETFFSFHSVGTQMNEGYQLMTNIANAFE